METTGILATAVVVGAQDEMKVKLLGEGDDVGDAVDDTPSVPAS